MSGGAAAMARLGLTVLERGWLSSNNVVFDDGSVADTGYLAHAAQTVALVEQALRGRPLRRIVNTHLHSDHCGGNAALQRRWPGCAAWVPPDALAAAAAWDEAALTFQATDQRCERFEVHAALQPGLPLQLGGAPWQVLAAPGHDPQAVMLWQHDERVLIAGDALWEDGVAVLFPELAGEPGFGPAQQVLDRIEALAPAWVIPGHGAPFDDVAASLAGARSRLAHFAAEPARHRDYAARALLMFHLLERRCAGVDELRAWLLAVPLFRAMGARAPWAATVIDRLVAGGALERVEDEVRIPGHCHNALGYNRGT